MKNVIKYTQDGAEVFFNDNIAIVLVRFLNNGYVKYNTTILSPAEMEFLLSQKLNEFKHLKNKLIPYGVDYYLRLAEKEWDRMRLLSQQSGVLFLDTQYIEMVHLGKEVYLTSNRISHKDIFNVALANGLKIMSRSEFIYNIIRKDTTAIDGGYFRISASKHEDFAYIALNNNIEEEIKDFLNNPSWYDNHADRCPIGIFNQNYSAVFTIENGKNIAYVARNAQGRIRSFGEILYPESWMEKLEKRNVCSVMTDENTAPKFEQNFPYACAWKFWATGNKIDFGFDE
ncbi:MAG: hypothetical protein ABIK73_07840 [candidate division WOR-3 bacterium]